jgi:hypothetical protein
MNDFIAMVVLFLAFLFMGCATTEYNVFKGEGNVFEGLGVRRLS